MGSGNHLLHPNGVLPEIPEANLIAAADLLPPAGSSNATSQCAAIDLPDGRVVEVTFVKVRGKAPRWSPDSVRAMPLGTLSDQRIISIITAAFSPYRCIAQLRNGGKIRFKVIIGSRRIHEEPPLPLADVQDERSLQAMISRVRKDIEARGYQLERR